MVPDGFQRMEHDLYIMLGELKGSMVALTKAFEDERDLARAERRISLERDDRFERAERAFQDHIDYAAAVEKQVMSNKERLDRLSERAERSEDLQKKVLGIFGLATFAFAMMLQGMWWALTHWAELGTFVKGLFKF